jgi:von Willebrand factor type D domain
VLTTIREDPHFRTHDGTKYSYHGQCDLILARSQSFGDGIGIDIHARTELKTDWSFISDAAIRIGSDTLEVVAAGDLIFFNGEPAHQIPMLMANKYKVIQNKTIVNSIDMKTGESITNPRSVYSLLLGDGDTIIITLFKGLLSVNVNAFFHDTEGMLGTHDKQGMVGRDHSKILAGDPNAMGTEWQVKSTDPMLFRVARSPQFPEACILPPLAQQSRRRLQTQEDHAFAHKACSGVVLDEDMYHFCLEDVLLTGDTDLAHSYVAGAF